MNIQEHISLKEYNTFGMHVYAKRFVSVSSFFALKNILEKEKEVYIISGGSNILLTKDISCLVIHIDIKGISIDKEEENYIYLTVNAGEHWHDFVNWCIAQNYGGLENLSLIPGYVGTAPIQNIGAYGVEVKDAITKVEGIDIKSGKRVSFSNTACNFGYRNSIFKQKLKNKVVITAVSFKLTKTKHVINSSYGAIESELKKKNIVNPSIKDISEAVISIRKSKLPDPKKIGNSGSFFKNPVIAITKYEALQKQFPKIPSYPISENEVKVPAGWLIENIGYKGKNYGTYGVHEKQALVLVNYGDASGKDIYRLAQEIQKEVEKKFGIHLEMEVNIL
ncbi:UDP-N-acetylmuramate dehydrogenase [Tenacibaculum sp. SG-28]|uniref:UDP-N-acetylmuramate dehydrogenase n=1 Tax=Tenacibaculum sp. SG-28 TaxID=754426 RepID=UPI000CF3B63E|nr:UDP-N-acetylmuramate dehydrogenase [Tenacibaculum sp. SG-28]PQJ23402.1 UDP-N-acetylenolpyruvoylglucosamine reductase [Tenacibaculum sp. SG-28]